MISVLLIETLKGEVLVNRIFRDDVPRNVGEAFRAQVIGAKEIRSPVKVIGEATFLHIRHEDVYIVAVTNSNVNAALVFEFLNRVVEVLKSYFGGALDEEAVRSNIFVIYELLDEMNDFGYPQVTSADLLKMSVVQEGFISEDAQTRAKQDQSFTIQATGAVSYRREGIKYRKNEVFLDVIESVNLLVSNKGNVLRSEVSGRIVMKSYLSGMPDCKFGLNDKLVLDREASSRRRTAGVEIDDVKFHQCVKLGKFDTDRTISFVPPDGEFELMKYRCSDNVSLPFRVHPHYRELGRTRLEVKITVKAAFDDRLFGTNVVIKLPVPENTASCNATVAVGKTKYDANARALLWKIARFQGNTELSLAAEVNLIASTLGTQAWNKPPIEMDFQVPMFTASGLKVRFLKVFEKSNYQTTKWVRYVTKGGSYQTRI